MRERHRAQIEALEAEKAHALGQQSARIAVLEATQTVPKRRLDVRERRDLEAEVERLDREALSRQTQHEARKREQAERWAAELEVRARKAAKQAAIVEQADTGRQSADARWASGSASRR